MSEILVSEKKDILNSSLVSFDERSKDLEEQKEKEEKKNKQEKNSPFTNFYQFNREHTKDMIKLASKYPKAHAILLFMLDQMDNYNALVCSYQVLEEALEMSKPTVTRSIKVLKDTNFITVYKSGTANVYAVNKDLAWASWGKNHKYAKFGANIIIAESEQEKKELKISMEKLKKINISNTNRQKQ